jgi:DNA repair photolyase
MSVTIQIPDDVMLKLQQRANREGIEPYSLATDLLRNALEPPAASTSERDAILQALREAGLLVELSPELRKRIIPGVTHKEVREALARAGGQPLSEIAIEQRGPKE